MKVNTTLPHPHFRPCWYCEGQGYKDYYTGQWGQRFAVSQPVFCIDCAGSGVICANCERSPNNCDCGGVFLCGKCGEEQRHCNCKGDSRG